MSEMFHIKKGEWKIILCLQILQHKVKSLGYFKGFQILLGVEYTWLCPTDASTLRNRQLRHVGAQEKRKGENHALGF